jgi:hypothetical protein
VVSTATSLWTGGSAVWFFSSPKLPRPMLGTSRVQQMGREIYYLPHLVAILRISGAMPSLPIRAFVACKAATLHLYGGPISYTKITSKCNNWKQKKTHLVHEIQPVFSSVHNYSLFSDLEYGNTHIFRISFYEMFVFLPSYQWNEGAILSYIIKIKIYGTMFLPLV